MQINIILQLKYNREHVTCNAEEGVQLNKTAKSIGVQMIFDIAISYRKLQVQG